MANLPANTTGIVSTTSITGSYAGFTVVSGSATFTGLKDGNGFPISTTPNWIIPAGTTVSICITSASLSSGAVLFYI